MRLDAMYRQIQQEAAVAAVVPSSMRGTRRRKLALSPPRMRALLAGRDLEVTLERTLVALKARDESGAVWFNQLNVAGGVGGGNGFNRAAVDLGRLAQGGGRKLASFKELKNWTSNDTPRLAVEELFAYCCWLLALRRRGISPYENELWKIDGIRLLLIAPESYFLGHGGVNAACNMLQLAEAEVAALRTAHPELSGVSLAPAPIVLPGRMMKDDFVRCFDTDAVNRLLAAGRSAKSALDVLRPEAIPALEEWLQDALVQAGVA